MSSGVGFLLRPFFKDLTFLYLFVWVLSNQNNKIHKHNFSRGEETDAKEKQCKYGKNLHKHVQSKMYFLGNSSIAPFF